MPFLATLATLVTVFIEAGVVVFFVAFGLIASRWVQRVMRMWQQRDNLNLSNGNFDVAKSYLTGAQNLVNTANTLAAKQQQPQT